MKLRLRLLIGAQVALGPGKADLLEQIAETGSISAAGRAMKMSYKRAWSLVEEMNAAFRDPLVSRSRGGPKGGGAELTETGRAVLKHFRNIERAAREAGGEDFAAIAKLRRDAAPQK